MKPQSHKSIPDSNYHFVLRKINAVRRRKKHLSVLTGLIRWVICCLGIGAVLIFLELLFWFSPSVRIVLFSIYLFGISAFGIFRIGIPLFSLFFRNTKPGDDQIANDMGRTDPFLRDRLIDAIQVYRNRKKEIGRTSEELAEAALADIIKENRLNHMKKWVDFTGCITSFKYLSVVLICVSVLFLSSPRNSVNATVRLFHPGQVFDRFVSSRITVYPGTVRVVQGENILIRAEIAGNPPKSVTLFLHTPTDNPHAVHLTPPFQFRIESIRKDLSYYFQSGKVRTKTYSIRVVERPEVRILQLVLKPPEYSRLGIQTLEPNTGDFEALPGTSAGITIKTNKAIQKAKLVFEREKQLDLTPNRQTVTGSFIVHKNDQYRIELKDHDELINSDPIPYRIRVKADGFPDARILSPSETINLDERMEISLVLEAEDDYGISSCRVGYCCNRLGVSGSQRTDTLYFPIHVEGKNSPHVFIRQNWELGSLHLLPEQEVSYFFEAADNDFVSGPKWARSRIQSARFPSLEEIYQEIEKDQKDQIQSLSSLAEETRSFREEIDKTETQLKIGKDISWEEMKNLEEQNGKQLNALKQFDDLENELNKMVEKMEENDFLSIQTLQKYEELQKLYEEIATPELQEKLKQFQDALKKVTSDELRKAMEQMQFSQEWFLRSLERTISLFKRIQIEQKTDELIKRIQEMSQRQKEVNAQLEGTKTPETGLPLKEDQIQNNAHSFQEEAAELRRNMQSLTSMPIRKMDAVIQSVQTPDLSRATQMMKQDLAGENFNSARSQGDRIVQQMQATEQLLSDMKKTLLANQAERLSNAMGRMSLGLLELSREQEELSKNSADQSLIKTEIEEKQQSLSEALDQKADSLYQLSRETFFITPEMGKSLGEAKSAMQQAMEQIKVSDILKTKAFQNKAMGSLNQTVAALMKEMENQAKGSGGGMESFFQKLEGMGEEQAGINRRMMDMLGEGRLSLKDQAAMARLATEQETLKERLRQLIREFGNRAEIAGSLDGLVQEMENVVKELKERNANRQTIRKQEQILSRLLDAQHSLYRQDYSQERQAKTGMDMIRRSPRNSGTESLKKSDRVRQDLIEAGKEGYTKEYIDLIEKYFDALSRSNPK